MRLSVIIPFHNEARTLSTVLNQIKLLDVEMELILVDDGSTDCVPVLPVAASNLPNVKLLRYAIRRGKGAAVRLGIEEATGYYTIIKDADLEQETTDIVQLYKEAESGLWDAVFGTRILSWPANYDIRHTVNLILTLCTNIISKGHLSDVMTGYKLVKTSLLKRLRLRNNGFDIEPEIAIKLLKRGVIIKEVPVTYHPRTVSMGKKIRPWHAIVVLSAIVRSRFSR
jgi:glycosyltransferase involved in cell wall biosynthesis